MVSLRQFYLNEVGMNIDTFSTTELWALYSIVIKRLKEIGQIRTSNITGERGESLAILFYNKTSGLPKLQLASKGTQNIDAISKNGERYAIKTVKLPRKVTGVFYGMGSLDNEIKEKKFEFVIIVVINEYYELEKIIELNWEQFLKNKLWHSRMSAYILSLSKRLYNNSKIIYDKKSEKPS